MNNFRCSVAHINEMCFVVIKTKDSFENVNLLFSKSNNFSKIPAVREIYFIYKYIHENTVKALGCLKYLKSCIIRVIQISGFLLA